MSKTAADGNLLADTVPPETGERFEVLGHLAGVEIERIVSSDAPDTAPYDQAWPEWALLVRGGAELEVDGARISMRAGDYLHLPAHTPHRVLSTQRGSVWLALHAKGGGAG
jgi:cupin 2 domain-containing protein